MQVFLIIVAIALVATFVFVKVKERREGGWDDTDVVEAPPAARATTRRAVRDDLEDDTTATVADEVDLDLDDEPEVVVDRDDADRSILDKSPGASSSWLEDLAVRDDDALADLEAIADTGSPRDDVVDDAPLAELDTTTVDEEFESITADFDVASDDAGHDVVIKEDVESADDIMANSKATEINPAGNTELQMLLQKVQARLSQYE